MGKKNQYVDDYTGDVASYQKRHRKFRILMSVLCVTGIVAAGSATYVLMNPAQTMTKEGIDEMDPNEDFVVSDEDAVSADGLVAEDLVAPEENYDDVPLIEEWTDDDKAPADAIPADDTINAQNPDVAAEQPALAGLPGMEETETEKPEEDIAPEAVAGSAVVEAAGESAAPEAVEETTAPEAAEEAAATEAVAETAAPEVIEETAAPEAVEETAASEVVVETAAPEADNEEKEEAVLQTEEVVSEEPEMAASENEAAETELTAAVNPEVETESSVQAGTEEPAEAETEEVAAVEETETETAAEPDETEEEVSGLTAAETGEESETESEEAAETSAEAETEEDAAEAAETETEETAAREPGVREKSKDEVYVETEGELLDEKWIDSVGLEVKTDDGWNTAESEDGSAIEVDSDQVLRFRVIYTVKPETLSEDMRTLIYHVPAEITSVEESYGEIVDADENVIANYAIDPDGTIRVTFTEEVAKLNAEGADVSCKIEFRTNASDLAQ